MPETTKEASPTTLPESSTPSTLRYKSSPKAKLAHRVLSLLRRITDEWSYFLLKLRHSGASNYADEEFLEALFESSDDDLFDRGRRYVKPTGLTPVEEDFIRSYKKCKLLDQYHETYREDMTPSQTDAADAPPYTQLDAAADQASAQDAPNPGERLWARRRQRWLTPAEGTDVPAKLEQRAQQLVLKDVSKDLYPRIYKDFVDKGKLLKPGKRINLPDMINIINAGWIAEKKWDRAAKGLP